MSSPHGAGSVEESAPFANATRAASGCKAKRAPLSA
jgi:hypothetical protein